MPKEGGAEVPKKARRQGGARGKTYTSGRLKHVRDETSRDGSATLVLLVLARVREVGNDGGDPASAGGAAGVDHDEHLHEAVVDVTGSGGL